jgi:prepilin-type N-terminal cleavage/methylation domain-containing protein
MKRFSFPSGYGTRRALRAALAGERGFTLVELVIAFAIMALMLVVLYGSFYLSERAVAKAAARADESQSQRTREEILAGYIRSAFPYRISARDASVYFNGTDRDVEFVSSLSTGLGGRGMSRVKISSDLSNSGAALWLDEEMPVRVGDKGSGGGGYHNNVLLAEGLRELHFEYLDPGTDQQQNQQLMSRQQLTENWVDQWDGKDKRALPRAVRLVFRGDRGEEVRWTFPIMIRVLAP